LVSYYEALDKIKECVSQYFTVEDTFYEAGFLTFVVAETEIKENFRRLYADLKKLGYVPTARRREGRTVIRVLKYREPSFAWARFRRLPLILFIATLAVITADGYFRASASVYELVIAQRGILDRLLEASLFAAFLMLIIGLHELGHIIAAKRKGMSATLPYFIPGIPGIIPTFGAVIFQKEPLINRDDMFDLGISGPVMSFLLSILVMLFAVKTQTLWLTEAEYASIVEKIIRHGGAALPAPLAMKFIIMLFLIPGRIPLLVDTVGLAAWIGFLITALNLLPIWQLDGSKVFRSVLTQRQHKIAGYISLVLLVLSNPSFIFIAILFFLLMHRMPDIPPLDEVSPLSKGRKLLFPLTFVMIALSLPLFFL